LAMVLDRGGAEECGLVSLDSLGVLYPEVLALD